MYGRKLLLSHVLQLITETLCVFQYVCQLCSMYSKWRAHTNTTLHKLLTLWRRPEVYDLRLYHRWLPSMTVLRTNSLVQFRLSTVGPACQNLVASRRGLRCRTKLALLMITNQNTSLDLTYNQLEQVREPDLNCSPKHATVGPALNESYHSSQQQHQDSPTVSRKVVVIQRYSWYVHTAL